MSKHSSWLGRLLVAGLAILCGLAIPAWALASNPSQGPGGPILIVTSSTSTFSNYYAEILRTEGVNEFAVADVSTLTAPLLAGYDVVVVAQMAVPSAQVVLVTNWVNAGGNLIVMAPDASLAGLLGITPSGATLSNGYLQVDTSSSPGNGIVGATMQFHGVANLFTTNGATRVATLYSSATLPTSNPAVTLNASGLGKASAFAFDLATSVVYTRQGNPAWATQERDGFAPVRSDDKFYGAAAGDLQPDWVDPGKIAIPQADEQQRLLINVIQSMDAKPLPRFWYLPNGKKAAVVMTGDDHANGGTGGRFDQFIAASPAGCSVANWECIRGTSYVFTGTPLTDAQAATYNAQGFEVSLHINTNCLDFTPSSLASIYASQLADWKAKFQSLPAPVTERHHCIVWSDWSTAAETELANGMRLDTSYYFWPPSWVNNVPGLFTGSAMPMRFARLDGTYVDVFMAVSQMTDESGQTYPYTIDTLLDRAVGPLGYYGAYTINAHTDAVDSPEATATVASAKTHGVSVVSSRQMLTWLDARNASSFGAQSWTGTTLGFTVTADPSATGLTAMLPTRLSAGVLTGLTRAGATVATTWSGVKGVEYASFPALSGAYVATYGSDITAPTVITTSPVGGATGVSASVAPTVTFSEAMSAASISGSTVELRDASNALVSAAVIYDASSRSAILTPTSALASQAVYTLTVHGGATDPRAKDATGNALVANGTWSFTTGAATTPPTCPCDVFGAAAAPGTAAEADANAVELGVRFSADVAGSVTGVRFYKGTTNTGTHIGNIWTSAGASLGSVTFTSESASGWQQMNFAAPIAISANTVYIASYFAPQGNYAADSGYFSAVGVDKPPLHLLKDGVAGGNGVYSYGSTSSFPSSTYNATNYWVEPVFVNAAPADTTPPTVLATSPASNSTSEGVVAAITATFSEALDPSTVSTATVSLTTALGAVVSGTVTYNSSSRTATFTPSISLPLSTLFQVVLAGGATDPRIKDLAGNALAGNVTWSFTTAASASACASPANPIVAENCLGGNPSTDWDVVGAGDASILGFATQISVNRGSPVSFKVNTTASAYRLDIYRMGYYSGMGARKVASITPSATLPQIQPSCISDASTGLLDCGNWGVSGTWTVPAAAASGIYFAKLVRTDTGGASHIFFVVRDDASTSDLLFQTSDTTWQAYNEYGGNSLYVGNPAGRAYKVSYNRPFTTRTTASGQDWVFNAEYPMVRWLESNGYNVAYFSGVDADSSGALILKHKTFLSVGHDEYWSGAQRTNVESARAAGVNLAFFSGNEVFWKTRWESSIDGSGTPYRTLVAYKETTANAKIDPTSAWTGTWRDPRFSPPADGGRPENQLTGTLFMNNDTGTPYAITVPSADGKMRLWRNTILANQAAGAVATLPVGTLGYEWDTDPDNGLRPPGLVRSSTTTITSTGVLQDWGTNYGTGTLTHYLTSYRHASGAHVFGAGTIQWAWGLDSHHDRGSAAADPSMQQATVNVLADMNAQPATLQSGLLPATASTDTTPPVSTILTPAAGITVATGAPVTVTGKASDSGGGIVGGVEVSVDGGTTWHPAAGRATWSYTWAPAAAGTVAIGTRAADDSGNIETPGAGRSITVKAQSCPCNIWSSASVPASPSDGDSAAVNVGVKFKADVKGLVSGVRFYKGAGNTGTHVGALWSVSGTLLGSVTFTGETTSGWQQMNFASPVQITANTVYVASYFAPVGHYAGDNGSFASAGVDNPPLHALQNGVSGGNGVYLYKSSRGYPNATWSSSNYWVDVVFTPN
jgi:hypothetical protein